MRVSPSIRDLGVSTWSKGFHIFVYQESAGILYPVVELRWKHCCDNTELQSETSMRDVITQYQALLVFLMQTRTQFSVGLCVSWGVLRQMVRASFEVNVFTTVSDVDHVCHSGTYACSRDIYCGTSTCTCWRQLPPPCKWIAFAKVPHARHQDLHLGSTE